MSHCNQLTSYLLGELSDEEETKFLQHVEQCEQCRLDLEELLPLNYCLLETGDEDIVLSNGLKEQTLEVAFAARRPKDIPIAKKYRSHRWWLQVVSSVAVLIVGVLLGSWTLIPQTHRTDFAPATMGNELALTTADPVNNSKGMAMVYKKGSNLNLVVYVERMKPLDNWGCYSVWVTENHKRLNLGDFTVNANGDAVLSVSLTSQSVAQTLQITREPTWNDSIPKGPTILGIKET